MNLLPSTVLIACAVVGGLWLGQLSAGSSRIDVAVSEWLVALPPGPERDAGVAELAEWLLSRDAQAAHRWAGEIGDTAERDRLQEAASEMLEELDPG